MCGLAGWIARSTDRPAPDVLTAMTDAIAHRGPDGSGRFDAVTRDGGHAVSLGHRRLAIIDVATGDQPMKDTDGRLTVVFNGEIYNFQALRTELAAAGARFHTQSDTEVLLHGWRHWGVDMVRRLRGMFVFALWDRRQQTLFLARDRMGKKPLYYAELPNGQIVFASEMRAMLRHPGIERNIDAISVDGYLALGYVPEPRSIYSGIRKLPAAHCLTIRRGQPMPEPKRYWTLAFHPTPMTEEDAAHELIERLRESTKLRLVSEVPLGAFLSGGVDSSAVVAMMAGLQDEPVRSFAIGFGGAEDELVYAQAVADRYGTHHTAERATVSYLDALDAQAAIFGEPFADSSAVPTGRVSELARRAVTVALSGDAGDELFAGYRRYRFHMAAERVRAMLPGGLRRVAFGGLAALYPKLDRAPRWLRAKTTLQEWAADEAEGFYRTVCKIPDAARRELLSPQMRAAIDGYRPAQLIRAAMDEAGTDDKLARAQYADIQTYLVGDILTKVDRATMAVSLEGRVPLLDHRVVEYAWTLPLSLKIREGKGKWALRQVLKRYVPDSLVDRPKQGFGVPIDSWLRGPLRDWAEDLLSPRTLASDGILRPEPVTAMWHEHLSGRRNWSGQLWVVLMFQAWRQRWA